jgi:hypothetical protein
MKRKHVSFKDSEKHLQDHALKYDFQDYVKRLIQYDLEHNILSKSNKKRNIYDIYNEKLAKKNYIENSLTIGRRWYIIDVEESNN